MRLYFKCLLGKNSLPPTKLLTAALVKHFIQIDPGVDCTTSSLAKNILRAQSKQMLRHKSNL